MEEMGVFRAALDPDSKSTVYHPSSATVELGGDGLPKAEEEEEGEETMRALVASEVEEKTGLAPVGEGEEEEGEMVVPTEIETPRMEEDMMDGVVDLSV